MELIAAHTKIPMPDITPMSPDIKIEVSQHWRTFHATEGFGAQNMIEPHTAYGEVMRQLPRNVDAFVLYTCLKITPPLSSRAIKKSSEQLLSHGLYVPKDRCRLVLLAELEQKQPELLKVALNMGASAALEVTNGFIAYDPEQVHIVQA